MPGESRVVVLDVDLGCSRCDKKIRKVLEKHKEEWNIKNISYDLKNNEVKISGSFDPHKLVKKLCKKARDVIREWCIKEPEKPKPPPPKPEPPKPDPKPPPPKPEPPKPDPPKPEPPKPKPEPPKPDPPKPCPDPPCHPTCYPLPYPYPLPCYLPWGGCDGRNKPCSCGCGCSGGCDGRNKPCSGGCGCSGGCSGTYQPQPTYVDYGRPCQWVCEEEPAVGCNIM